MKRSLASGKLPQILAALEAGEQSQLAGDWAGLWARGEQMPPEDGDWRNWLILGGRGGGKTRAGAEWVKARATGDGLAPARRIALVAPSFDEARMVMVEGASGLLAIHPPEMRPRFEPTRRQLTWANGAIAQIFSAAEPEGLRGPQFDAAWCDELAKWKRAAEVWDMLQFSLRLGERPQALVTTTPRAIPLLRRIMADPATFVSHAPTARNAANLAPSFLGEMSQRYGGTRLGRQELEGELIEDDPDALFNRGMIEKSRLAQAPAPAMARIVVAVDPPASVGSRANACGIICAGLGQDGRAYVLDDCSVKGATPAGWARKAVALYHARGASRVVAEVNQGGAMVEAVLREIDPNVSFRAVHASKGKQARAEPVAALYEQGRVSHVGSFPELEDEMCARIETTKSPDRLDAMVWAITDLMLRQRLEPRIRML